MMCQKTGQPAFEGADGVSRELLGAVGRVRRAPDGIAAGNGDHVVDRRNLQTHDRQRRRIGRMGVNNGIHVFNLLWGKVHSLEEYFDSQAADRALAAQAKSGLDEATAEPIVS